VICAEGAVTSRVSKFGRVVVVSNQKRFDRRRIVYTASKWRRWVLVNTNNQCPPHYLFFPSPIICLTAAAMLGHFQPITLFRARPVGRVLTVVAPSTYTPKTGHESCGHGNFFGHAGGASH